MSNFRPSGINRVPLSMQEGSPGRELLKTILEPGRIFMGDWRDLSECAEPSRVCTKEDVYVYEMYSELDEIAISKKPEPTNIWVRAAVLSGSTPLYRHIDWRPGYCDDVTHVILLPHTVEDTATRVVLKVVVKYRADDTDDDYMPYSAIELSVYACDNEDDQKQCLDDLSYETYVRMYTEGIQGREGTDPNASMAYAAFLEATKGAFPDLAKTGPTPGFVEGLTDKLSKEFSRVSELYYAEDKKREDGEENEFDFYEGYREGLSCALLELRKNEQGGSL